MKGGLPAVIDPLRLAREGARLVGRLPLESMRRLKAACLEARGGVELALQFEQSAQGLGQMRGHIEARLTVRCQRCLEPMGLTLKSEPRAVLLSGEDRQEQLAAGADMIVITKPVSLVELVEDELLLAMPMMPMHPREACPAAPFLAPDAAADDATSENRPFSVLGKLKRPRE